MSSVSSRAWPAVLSLVAIGLSAVIWLEVSGGIPDSRGVIAPRTSPAGVGAAVLLDRPAMSGRDQVAAWAETAQARPLFNVRRRPAVVAVSTAPAAGAALPRMTGTLVTPSMRRAFFAGADGRAVVVAEGGQLGGFTVTAIQAGRITVSGPGGERTIIASFDPNPPGTQAGRPTAGGGPGVAGLPGLQGLNLGGVPGLTAPMAAR